MTDLEKLKALYDAWGVDYEVQTKAEDCRIKDDRILVTCTVDSPKVVGYSGFICDHNFDKDGKFIEIGIWE